MASCAPAWKTRHEPARLGSPKKVLRDGRRWQGQSGPIRDVGTDPAIRLSPHATPECSLCAASGYVDRGAKSLVRILGQLHRRNFP